ncbi:MAG: exosortase O [Ardenticatenaceae bacterium]|nr:exosortase O [Ardenticatenaceae bacterium]
MAATNTKSATPKTETAVHIPQLTANILILAAWTWLYWPLADYLQTIFTREDFRTNQILLIAVAALIISQVRNSHIRPRFDAPPRLAALPLALTLGGSLAYLACERFLDVNTLSATLFGLASYGLLGLWLQPARWRAGLPAALLLIGTLPFGEHMQTFIGYPMRIATAALVRDGLAASGVGSIGIDTILVFENGISQVDIPCSGVKSLWTGAMFLIAATWIERRPITWRWWGTAVLFAIALFLANLTRVAILVTVGAFLGWKLIAAMLHVPLGVLGFIAACAFALWLLRQQKAINTPTAPSSPSRLASRQRFFTPVLLASIILMAAIYTPRPVSGLDQPAPTWAFPDTLTVTPLPFKPDEYDWLTRDGADSASRYRFTWEGVSGSMILITSHTWRAHHRPERCFEVYGLTLEDSRTHLVSDPLAENGDPLIPVRFVTLGQGDWHETLSATYWFQSAAHTTDDYGTRIWADLSQREEWVLVSILFDDVYQADNPQLNSLYLALHEVVAASIGNQ